MTSILIQGLIFSINSIKNNKVDAKSSINKSNPIDIFSTKQKGSLNNTKAKKGRASRERSKRNRRLKQSFQSYIRNSKNILILNQNDDTDLVRQLGFIPHHMVEISSRLINFPSFPRVIQKVILEDDENIKKRNYYKNNENLWMQPTAITLYPLSPKPFPTIYWLTNKLLSSYIAKMEESDEWNIKQMENQLLGDSNSKEKIKKSHEMYGQERVNMISISDLHLINEKNWIKSVGYSGGIGGTSNWKTIKCLHLHVAHYLVWYKRFKEGEAKYFKGNENIVGRWVLEGIETWLEKNGK